MSGRRAIALVATREIRERLRSKAFIASTLLILALLAVSAVIGRLFDPQRTFDYAVTAPAPPGLAIALQRAAEPFDDAKVKLRTVDSAQAGRRLLEDGKVDALLLVSTDRLVFRKNVDAQVAAALVQALAMPEDVMSVGFSPDGRWLVASAEDGIVTLWRLRVAPAEELI